jgi:putative transcriptional regulator
MGMDKIKLHIIGDVVLSDDIGKSMKKWRDMFGISQIDVSRYLGLSPSVISDYESGRRKNPGVIIIRRYIETLINIDREKGGHTIKALQRVINPPSMNAILQIKEYGAPISIGEFLKIIDGKIVHDKNNSSIETNIFGHTVVDSVKAILEMDGQDFINLYGWTTERALIFTNVSTGRSPMVAIRVSSIKPRVVVFQGHNKLDKLALKIAEIEGIMLITTDLELDELLKRLK